MSRRLDLSQALALAFSHIQQNRLPEARRLARDLERARPDLPGLAYLHGLLALADGQGRKAAQHLARALAQTPEAVPPLLAMARAQAMQGRRAEAVQAYDRLLTVAPAMPEALAEKGALLAEDGRLAEAALALAQALDLNPAQPQAETALARVLRRLKRPTDAAEAASRATELAPAAVAAWLELGLARRDQAQPEAALAAFDQAVARLPGSAECHWLRAEALRALDRTDEAAAACRRVLELDPTDGFGAALALAQLGAAPAPAQASEAYLRTLFDQYAAGFDRDLVEGLGYQGPALLIDAITRTLGHGPFDALDLGCGTGLMGGVLRPLARRLEGVDLSPRMVDKATERGLYDRLTAGDLLPVLRAEASAWDLITAADVFVYLGDLTPVFAAAAQALRPQGALVFSTERGDGDGFQLGPASRYAHSPAYLRQLAEAQGLTVVLLEEASTRREGGQPVAGLVAVLRKG